MRVLTALLAVCGSLLLAAPATAADRVERGIVQSLGPGAIVLRALDGTDVTVALGPATRYLDVVDDGPGLAAADLSRAFERFYLYDRARDGRRVGTGLGLAIVRELAVAMGGEALVRSTPGVGSTFSLVLPVGRPATPAPEPGRASPRLP